MDLTLKQVAKKYNLDKDQLYRTCKKYDIEGVSAGNSTNSPKRYTEAQIDTILERLGLSKEELEKDKPEDRTEKAGSPAIDPNQNKYIEKLEKDIEYLKQDIDKREQAHNEEVARLQRIIDNLQEENKGLIVTNNQAQQLLSEKKKPLFSLPWKRKES